MLADLDIDANPVRPHALAGGLDVWDTSSIYITCENPRCGTRFIPLSYRQHLCGNNACRMQEKKRRKREGWNRPKHDLYWKPWTNVRTKEQREASAAS